MAHRVNDHIDPDSIRREPILKRITRVVDPFPRVSQITVSSDEREQPALLVLYTHVVRNDSALFMGDSSIQPRTDARNLNHFLDVEVAMKDRVIERQVFDLVL